MLSILYISSINAINAIKKKKVNIIILQFDKRLFQFIIFSKKSSNQQFKISDSFNKQMKPRYEKHLEHEPNTNIYIKNRKNLDNEPKTIQYFPQKKKKIQLQNHNNDRNKSNNISQRSSDSSRYVKKQNSFTLTNSTVLENKQLNKKIQTLNKQIQKYQKMTAEKDDKNAVLKIYQTQLGETYRVINYYQGKLSQLEKICKNYELIILPQTKKVKNVVNKSDSVIQKLRKDNVQLKGQVQKKNYQLNKITIQLRKIQSKYFNNQQKIIELNKKISSKPNLNNNGDQKLKTEQGKNTQKIIQQKQKQKQKISQNENFIKRRPGLTLSKNKIRAKSGEKSDTSQSDGHSDYKSNIYIRKRDPESIHNSSIKINNKNNYRDQKSSQYFGLNRSKSKGGITNRVEKVQDSHLSKSMLASINSKLNVLEKQVESLKKQNQELQGQLDSQVKQNIKLREKVQAKQIKNVKIQKIEPQTIIIPKNKLKQIPNSPLISNQSTNSTHKLSSYISNISPKTEKTAQQNVQIRPLIVTKTYKFKRIQDKTLRNLTLNISRNELTYLNLINNLTLLWTSQNFTDLKQFLQDSPCLLSQHQTTQFLNEYHEIMRYIQSKQNQTANKDMNETQYKKLVQSQIKNILKDNIQYFKNITIRRDYSLNIQLSNKFKNYEEEIEKLNKMYGNRMMFDDGKRILIGKWGFSNEEFLFLMIRNKEEFDDIQYIHFEDLAKYFLLA